MFDPYAERISSTGEPPTDSSSAQLSVQEPDSGYEASPSSIAENQRFFGEQSNGSRQSRIDQSNLSVNSDEEYNNVEYDEQILFSNSDSEDYETCPECSSSAVSCSCFRTDSSNTNCTAMSNCDNSRCSSSEQFTRPSSQPIQIPNLPIRITSDVSRRIVIGSPVNIGLLTRSQPTNFNPFHRLDLIPDRLPLSWPSNSFPNYNNFALNNAQRSNVRDIPRSNVRRRHSENSSFGTSDDEDEEEGPEDVFHMPDEASSYPTMMTMSSAPLPDVIPESTDTGRRSRSMSINLPPDRAQILYNVGRNLRRMSDEFLQRRQLSMARRGRSRTESECGDHLHRNGLS